MAELVTPKNKLKEKVGSGGFNKEAIAKAEKSIEENTIDFKPIAQLYLDEVTRIVKEYRAKPNNETFSKLMDPLMQLRAQGTFFKYPSISKLADIVVDLLDSEGGVNAPIIDMVDAFTQSTHLLLKSNAMDEKNPVFVALSGELKAACQRYARKKEKDGV